MKKLLFIFIIPLFLIGCSGSVTSTIEITTSCSWSGAFAEGLDSISSMDGTGNKIIDCGSADYVGATVQKNSNDSSRLYVEIVKHEESGFLSPGGDTVVQDGYTTAAYGVVSIDATIK